MPNRLINETSPYLLQHAYNPVDWYPWGEEALTEAKIQDKPILLSVGYSACHWCHVMERESFENPQIADLMNEHFICIKVDREERPDIDLIYMAAVQALTGRGGWPMTVFTTARGEPFYGGTYFPPENRHGLPGFPRILQTVADTYRQNRNEVLTTASNLVEQMRKAATQVQNLDPITVELTKQAYLKILPDFDDKYGGIGMEPKFPQPMTYEFLLRYYLRTKEPQALKMVTMTLDRMAKGGIYDQLGGGFHRYSTDMFWLVPHFEKMLYDNALLVKLYTHTYQITKNPLYKRIVNETLQYVIREMTSREGGFYSAQDADSQGTEGKYFVWRPEEVKKILGEADGEIFNEYFGVTVDGNFDGLSVLNISSDIEAIASRTKMSQQQIINIIERSRKKLLECRDKRVKPARDEKILTAWNGLMIGSFAEAGSVLNNYDYIHVAEKCASFILDKLCPNGRLVRVYKDSHAKLNGYLEDYAFLIEGLLNLHEATLHPRWLLEAVDIGHSMVELFWDNQSDGFFDTGYDHENLVLRPKNMFDNAIPSGISMATEVLLRLAVITGNIKLQNYAVRAMQSAERLITHFPTSAGQWLSALEFHVSTPKEIVIIGDRSNSGTQSLIQEIYRHFIPIRVVMGKSSEDSTLAAFPLMKDRNTINGLPTVYVCQNYQCEVPVNNPSDLAKQLII